MDDLHLNISRLPAFAIREPIANLRYPMNETRGSFKDALKGFVQDYLDGKLQPTIKSEPVPKKLEDTLVKVVGQSLNTPKSSSPSPQTKSPASSAHPQ